MTTVRTAAPSATWTTGAERVGGHRMPAGYSGKPLAAKLGIKPGARAYVMEPPADYMELLDPLPEGVRWKKTARGPIDFVHLFVKERSVLERRFPVAARQVAEGGMIWVSWPKKASKIPTDVTEDVLREVVLPTGWVDVKVAAIDEVWSGLKFLKRRRPMTKKTPAETG